MLLVLDNCEHVVEGAASLVDALLDSCPDLRILATSREAVGVAGEVRWTVPALSVPVPGSPPAMEDLEGYESARLFTTPSPATTSAAIGRTSSGTIRAPVTSYDPTTATPAFRPVCAVRINAVQGEGPVPAGPEPYCGEERRTLAR
jgi:hypothetical protein